MRLVVLLCVLFFGMVIADVQYDHLDEPTIQVPTVPKPNIPEVIIPEATTPEALPTEATTPEATTPEALPTQATTLEAATPTALPTEATTPEASTPEALPTQATTLEAATPTALPTEASTPEAATPTETITPEETTPEETTPVATTPEETTPEQPTPEETITPEETTPEETTPVATTPEETTPEATTPEETTPEETTPEPTTPEPTTPEPFELPLAEECDEELCKLPDCRCSSTDNPGGLSPKDTPQFVTITFDDGVNVVNIETYRNVLYNVRNSNGCPAGVTFYVSHEYTNYVLVNELYNRGHEIALHSISHRTPQGYWADADYDVIKEEIADQRILISHFANIPFETIKGVRLPFLQMSGNESFHVMADYGLDYDCSWPTTAYTDPGLWPYSLDYASKQDCIVPPCPTASIPKTWVQPMVSWTDLVGFPCSMADSCFFTPDLEDEDAWYEFIVDNFNRHYEGNRAPFGYYIHEWYLAANPAVRAAFIRFLDLVSSLDDAFMVTASEVLDWVRNPIPVDEYRAKSCRQWRPMPCVTRSCGPIYSEHNQMTYWMQLCNACPRVHPWTGNPLGV